MADAYANPVMVDALIQGREGITTGPDNHFYYPPATGLEDPRQMERWESWVRAFVAVGELMNGINFRKTPGNNNAFQVRYGATLIAEVGRPKQATFKDQIEMVLSWAELRNERATEILGQIDPQYAFWSSIVFMRSDQHRRTFELINMMLQLCVYVEMRFKHALGCWRPVEYNAQVQPMITTPGHGSFPMGHGTNAYAVAHVIKALLKLNTTNPKHAGLIDQLDRQAARISTNRVIAGVHFPVDSMAGRMLGEAIGEFFVGRCVGGKRFKRRRFIASGIDAAPTTDFNPFASNQTLGGGAFYAENTGPTIPKSPLLEYVWGKALEEWADRFP
ncbi:MAG: phosphatase PAP2 family protein [Bradyrhizobium sp.]|nr:phosphatase PAP2 family protein [Bradyrhizobium sp.]